jgi:hypothetical protein
MDDSIVKRYAKRAQRLALISILEGLLWCRRQAWLSYGPRSVKSDFAESNVGVGMGMEMLGHLTKLPHTISKDLVVCQRRG